MFLFCKDQNKGFTLMEIIVVVVTVSILASLALPRMTGIFERVRASEGVSLLTALLVAQKAYQLEFDAYATDPDDLEIEILRSSNFDESTIDVFDDVNNVAEITRLGDDYTLSIDEDGVISCADVSGPITCGQAGY